MDRSTWSPDPSVLLNRSCLRRAIELPKRLLGEVGGASSSSKGNPDSLPVGLVHVELVEVGEWYPFDGARFAARSGRAGDESTVETE